MFKCDENLKNQELRCNVKDLKVEIMKTNEHKENPIRWLVITLDFTDYPLTNDGTQHFINTLEEKLQILKPISYWQ